MRKNEAIALTKYMVGLFPGQVTEQHRAAAIRQFVELEKSAVTTAIDRHHRERKTIDWQVLFAACEEPVAAKISESAAQREGTWADVMRRQNASLAGAGDIEVILRVHRGWWHRANGDGYRQQFQQSCRNQLFSSGMTIDEAAQTADLIFSEPRTFDLALQELRGNLPVSSAAHV